MTASLATNSDLHEDLPAYWADASKADRDLNWRVTRNLDEMAQDTWHWQSRHPQGYPD